MTSSKLDLEIKAGLAKNVRKLRDDLGRKPVDCKMLRARVGERDQAFEHCVMPLRQTRR